MKRDIYYHHYIEITKVSVKICPITSMPDPKELIDIHKYKGKY